MGREPQAPPAFPPIETAAEVTIREHVATTPTVFRFAANPQILVFDFPSLTEQGRMLNRVAALIEKAGAPRGRVLDDAALAAFIGAGGNTPETFYFGHDYRAADLARFFRLAERDRVVLNTSERHLRDLLRGERWDEDGANGALISIPPAGHPSWLDPTARAAILHHELSHGEYFSVAAYADYAGWFWTRVLAAAERERFRSFLAGEGYDRSIDDLMINEMQAYLMHTPDARFFDAAALGIPPARLRRLRAEFLVGMPPGWLRDCVHLPAAQLPSPPPRR